MSAKGDIEKYKVIFVLGGPGSGKGTQCENIENEFGYVHLSAGDLLRKERNNPNSEFGKMIEEHMVNGTIVPVKITCGLLEKAMKESGKNKFLIDGFPRNEDNLTGWNEALHDKVDVQMVIYITCDDDVCVKRCLSRGTGRVDDNDETLRKRLEQFRNQCMPIIKHFEEKKLVFNVNGNESKENVFQVLKKRISKL